MSLPLKKISILLSANASNLCVISAFSKMELQFLQCYTNCVGSQSNFYNVKEKTVQLLHWNCHFFTAKKQYVLQCKKWQCFFFCCILKQCIHYTGIVKRSSAKQDGCSGHVFGYSDLRISNPGAEVPGVAPKAPNVLARGADDTKMPDKVAQRDSSDTESISCDEIRVSPEKLKITC